MASEAPRARLTAVVAACCCFAFGCARVASDVSVTWTLEPTPASTSTATLVRFEVKHDDGKPVERAQLRVEAHMLHPGMEPAVGDAIERGNGTYETRLNLSMPGRWVIVVTGTLSDGRRFLKQTEVTAVPPSS